MAVDLDKLIAGLKSDDVAVRTAAAESLCHEVESAQPAAIPLVLATGDEEEEVREWAVGALEDLGPPAAQDVDCLAALLGDGRGDIGYWAATLLGRLQADGAGAVLALAAALMKEEIAIPAREQIAWALGEIGTAARAAVDPLKQAAAGSERRLARLAGEALEQIQQPG